jgi:hypothetical protein
MHFCNPSGYGFAGVEFSQECYCDFVIQDYATKIAASQCDDACAGDSKLTCGGSNAISIFANLNPNVVHPVNKPFVGPWKYMGCFTESLRGGRNLQSQVSLSGPVSVETCTAACKASNFILAGLENGDECWCGNVMQNIDAVQTPDADCGSACSGDTSEFCGSAVPGGGPTFTTRQTIYQDTAAPIPFNTCLQTGSFSEDLVLDAFSQIGPSSAIPLQVTSDSTFPSGFFIFSGCSNCATVTVIGYLFESGAVDAISSFPLNVVPASFSVNVGDSPSLMDIVVFQQPPGFSGYCAMANPLNPKSPVFQPLLLGAHSHADLWALCPNITAGGRLDLVFSPIATNPHYSKSHCKPVFIQITSTAPPPAPLV